MALSSVSPKTRRRDFFGWLFVIWLAGWIGIILAQVISWSNPLQGLLNGVIAGGIFSPFLMMVTVPLGTVGWFLGALRPLAGHRRAISFLFAAALPLYGIGTGLEGRLRPEKLFEQRTGVHLPEGTKIESAKFAGGLFADTSHEFLITCTGAGTDELIENLRVKANESGGSRGDREEVESPKKVMAGDWLVREIWSYAEGDGGKDGKTNFPDFLQLQTDETRTRVRIAYQNI